MGRLFWKFFLFFFLAQLFTAMGVGALVWFRGHYHQNVMWNQEQERILLSSGVATMRHGGVMAFMAMISNQRTTPQPPLFAFDESGRELLGRLPPDFRFDRHLTDKNEDKSQSPIEKVLAPDGHAYWLMVGHPRPPPDFLSYISPFKPPFRGQGPRAEEWRQSTLLLPLLSGLFFSFVFAAILARYVSKPILSLHHALVAFAGGNLNIRIHSLMGKRRDELAALGKDFDRMAQQLQNLMSGQQRLLHDVSHELRSPLARLQANIGLMRQHPNQVDLEIFMQRLELESERIDKLVNELLTLSRLESGIKTGSSSEIDLSEILTIIANDAQIEGQSKSLVIDLKTQDQILINVDAELLHRAIENIVRNAIKHSPDRGVIKIAVNIDPTEIHISVTDQGTGVPTADLEKIFEPFYRSNAGEAINGHGLGLAIAQRVVQTYDGIIHAANEPQGGFKITIVFPKASLS